MLFKNGNGKKVPIKSAKMVIDKNAMLFVIKFLIFLLASNMSNLVLNLQTATSLSSLSMSLDVTTVPRSGST